jgi:hypothetical protein
VSGGPGRFLPLNRNASGRARIGNVTLPSTCISSKRAVCFGVDEDRRINDRDADRDRQNLPKQHERFRCRYFGDLAEIPNTGALGVEVCRDDEQETPFDAFGRLRPQPRFIDITNDPNVLLAIASQQS